MSPVVSAGAAGKWRCLSVLCWHSSIFHHEADKSELVFHWEKLLHWVVMVRKQLTCRQKCEGVDGDWLVMLTYTSPLATGLPCKCLGWACDDLVCSGLVFSWRLGYKHVSPEWISHWDSFCLIVDSCPCPAIILRQCYCLLYQIPVLAVRYHRLITHYNELLSSHQHRRLDSPLLYWTFCIPSMAKW